MSPHYATILVTVAELAELYSGLCQASKRKLFAKVVNGLQPSIVFAESSIFDDWQGFEDTSEYYSVVF